MQLEAPSAVGAPQGGGRERSPRAGRERGPGREARRTMAGAAGGGRRAAGAAHLGDG